MLGPAHSTRRRLCRRALLRMAPWGVLLASCAASPGAHHASPHAPTHQDADAHAAAQAARRQDELELASQAERQELARQMTGAFSSARQAQQQPAYLDIRLHMVPIWTSRQDGPWLYVEQAAASTPEQPYRQRVYQLLTIGPGAIESRVFELPDDPSALAGAWRQPGRLDVLSPAQLVRRQGCSVFLTYDAAARAWTGATRDADCQSALRGASYATSHVTIHADGMTSWDRGFDASGVQVWGAADGPYRFDREPDSP